MSIATDQTAAQQIDAAITAHSRWKHRLKELVQTGKSDIDAATATRDDACEFGKWLQAYRPTAKEKASYEAVRTKHAEFHRVVGGVVRLVASSQKAEAMKSMDMGSPFASVSAALTLEMMNWKRIIA
jgi:hypothetical protein